MSKCMNYNEIIINFVEKNVRCKKIYENDQLKRTKGTYHKMGYLQ